MNTPSQSLICNPQIEWSKLLSSVSFRPFHVSLHLPWLCECRYAFDREKMLKVGRKKRKEKKEKKHTNSIARIRARASPPAVSFACLKLYHAAKETKYKIPTISDYYVTITRPTVWKRNTSHLVSNVNKGNKREVNRANIFCGKH